MKKKPILLAACCLATLSACSSLPSCSSSETVGLVEEIVNSRSFILGKFVELKDIKETAFNQNSEIRMCRAELVTTHGSENVDYSISWQDKEENKFYVELR